MARPRRRIMRKFKMTEISAVDSPAQAGARMVIMKRDTEEVAKAAFLEALTAVNVERDIFEDLWKFNDALRESIKSIFENPDQYPDPSAAVKESLDEFASAVSTMIEGTISVVGKAETKTEGGDEFPAKDYAYVPDPEKPSTWKLRLTSEPGGDPDPRIVGAAVAALGEGFRGNPVEIPEDDRPAVVSRVRAAWLKANSDKTKDDLPDVLKSEGGEPMTPKPDPQNTPSAEDLQKDLEKANARADRAEKVAELTDVQKAHFSGLDDEGKDAFLKMDADARAAELKKTEDDNPVVYKSEDGEEFRKNDDPRLVRMAKQADEDRKLAKKEREERQAVELAKRADEGMNHLPGEQPVKIAVLKAFDSIEDEELRKGAFAMLKASDAAASGAFEKKGTTAGTDDQKPADKLESMAKKYAEENDVPFAKAYNEVLKTDEGRQLYEQT